jgi:hypothetical protein
VASDESERFGADSKEAAGTITLGDMLQLALMGGACLLLVGYIGSTVYKVL